MSYEPLPTPNPSEFALRVWVSALQVMGKLGTLVAGTTTLEQMNLGIVPTSEGFGDYVYTYAEGPNDKGELGLWFAKAKTDEEKNTAFQAVPRFEPQPWDSLVFGMRPVQDLSAVKSGVTIRGNASGYYTSPSWNLAVDRVQGGMRGTRVIRYEFTSPTPYNIPNHRAPVPKSIHVLMPDGESYTEPEALYEDLVIPAMATATESIVDGVGYGNAGVVPEQRFDATNVTTWRREVILDQQQRVNGVWHRTMDVKLPPPVPEPDTVIR